MPQAATKFSAYIDKIDAVFKGNHRLGDIDRYEIEKLADDLLAIDACRANLLKGLLYALDNDEAKAVASFERAVVAGPASLEAHVNFAMVLATFGLTERAHSMIVRSLELCEQQGDWSPLDHIAHTSVTLGDVELQSKILKIANKLGRTSTNLTVLASMLALGSGDACVDQALSESFLKQNAVPLSGARWERMSAFADEIAQYLE